MTEHICTVCHQPSHRHEECGHFPALCCEGCACGSFEEAHPTHQRSTAMTNQPPPLDAEPTLDEQIVYWRYVMGTDDMPRMLHPSHIYDRAILASLERLRATQRESGGAQFPDFSCDDDGAFTIEWYIDNRNVLSVSVEDDSLHAAWMVDGAGGSYAWELCTPTPKAVVAAYCALSASQRKECDVCGGTGQVPHQSTSRFDVTPANELVPWEMRSTCQYCAGTGQRKETP